LRRELSEARNSLFKRMIKSDQYEKVANIRQAKVCSLSIGFRYVVKKYRIPKVTDANTDSATPLYIFDS
jgi:hypothetical protein